LKYVSILSSVALSEGEFPDYWEEAMDIPAADHAGIGRPAPTRDRRGRHRTSKPSGSASFPVSLRPDKLARVRDALHWAADEDRARGWEQKFRLD
jgi:hypothetical protein